MIHRIFPCDVGLHSLYLLEYLLFVLPVVVVKVIIVSPNVGFEHIEDAVSHILALTCLYCLVDEVGELLYLLDCVRGRVHLNCDVTAMGLEGCFEVDLALCIQLV